eukprot:scaffold1452_cov236-Pinguiococcus_pyrenoidosus.AAC.14
MISIGSQAAAGFGSASLGLPNAAPTSSPAVENAKTPAVICRGSAAHAFAFVLVGIAASLAPSSTADKGSEPGPGLAPGLGPGLGSGPAPLPCSASASLTCTGSGLASSGKPRPSCSARNSATSSASPSNWTSNPSETRLGGLMGTLLIAICGTVSGKKPKTVEMGATASERLSEEDHVWLQHAAALSPAALRDPPAHHVGINLRGGARVAAALGAASRGVQRAMARHVLGEPRHALQAVDVLRVIPEQLALPLQRGEEAVHLGGANAAWEQRPCEAIERLRIVVEILNVEQGLGAGQLQIPLLNHVVDAIGTAKVGNPARHRDARAGDDHDVPRPLQDAKHIAQRSQIFSTRSSAGWRCCLLRSRFWRGPLFLLAGFVLGVVRRVPTPPSFPHLASSPPTLSSPSHPLSPCADQGPTLPPGRLRAGAREGGREGGIERERGREGERAGETFALCMSAKRTETAESPIHAFYGRPKNQPLRPGIFHARAAAMAPALSAHPQQHCTD